MTRFALTTCIITILFSVNTLAETDTNSTSFTGSIANDNCTLVMPSSIDMGSLSGQDIHDNFYSFSFGGLYYYSIPTVSVSVNCTTGTEWEFNTPQNPAFTQTANIQDITFGCDASYGNNAFCQPGTDTSQGTGNGTIQEFNYYITLVTYVPTPSIVESFTILFDSTLTVTGSAP